MHCPLAMSHTRAVASHWLPAASIVASPLKAMHVMLPLSTVCRGKRRQDRGGAQFLESERLLKVVQRSHEYLQGHAGHVALVHGLHGQATTPGLGFGKVALRQVQETAGGHTAATRSLESGPACDVALPSLVTVVKGV